MDEENNGYCGERKKNERKKRNLREIKMDKKDQRKKERSEGEGEYARELRIK